MKFYFIDNSTDKEGIINAKNERDALIKLIQRMELYRHIL